MRLLNKKIRSMPYNKQNHIWLPLTLLIKFVCEMLLIHPQIPSHLSSVTSNFQPPLSMYMVCTTLLSISIPFYAEITTGMKRKTDYAVFEAFCSMNNLLSFLIISLLSWLFNMFIRNICILNMPWWNTRLCFGAM